MSSVMNDLNGQELDGLLARLSRDPTERAHFLQRLLGEGPCRQLGICSIPEGFLLSEVPLGTGAVDLAGVVEVLRRARPQLRFSLEMITRDPLRIPCLPRSRFVRNPMTTSTSSSKIARGTTLSLSSRTQAAQLARRRWWRSNGPGSKRRRYR